jgi:hypothetical protein
MAFQTILGFAFFYFLVASDAGRVGGSIGPWNHLLMNDITMTIKACELRLLDVQSMGYFDIPVNLFPPLLDVLMTVDAVLIDEIVFAQKLVGEDLTWFCMTVDTGHPGRMNRLGPHHDSGLIHMAMETDTWVGHENMTGRNDEGYPQNDDTWEDTEEKPFSLNQVQDGPLYEVSDFHSSDSSSMVLG